MSNTKTARREQAIKQAKRKKIVLIAVAVSVVMIAAIISVSTLLIGGAETYSDGHQIITLSADGSFTASLAHETRYSGTYERISGGVMFTYGGRTAFAEVEGDELELPHEWNDGHGHGSHLTKR